VANQVFVELATELHEQGVSRKVSADMFGMALRAYLRKLRRLQESSTDRGRSLWEAVLEHIGKQPLVSREQVLLRFRNDDPAQVKGVLHDLSESGLVFSTGSGGAVLYRAASEEDLRALRQSGGSGLEELIWLQVYREGPLSRAELAARQPREQEAVDAAIERLLRDGRVRQAGEGGQAQLTATHFAIPLGAEVGWEAAVADHFQAMVQAISQRLGGGRAEPADEVGGSTYTFDVWPGHPLEDEVRACLARFREHHGELRQRVEQYNAEHGLPGSYREVVVYAGQCVREREREGRS
jgi:hypothetical protein